MNEIISPWELYLIFQLDSIQSFLISIGVFGAFCTLATLVSVVETDFRQKIFLLSQKMFGFNDLRFLHCFYSTEF